MRREHPRRRSGAALAAVTLAAALAQASPAAAQPRERALLVAPSPAAGQRFGAALLAERYAFRLVVGAPGDGGGGAVYRYEFDPLAGRWKMVERVAPSSAVVTTAGIGAYGASVAGFDSTLTAYLVVGAPETDLRGARDAGAVFYFYGRRDAPYTTLRRFIAPDAASGDRFGAAVGFSGSRLIVGSPGDDDVGVGSGSAYVFYRGSSPSGWKSQKLRRPGGKAWEQFGSAVAVRAGNLVIGAPGAYGAGARRAGAVEVYDHAYPTYVWKATLRPPASHAATTAEFGAALAVSSALLVVGAPGSSPGGKAGAGRVFVYTGSSYRGWKLDRVFDGAVAGGRFGAAVAIGYGREDVVVVGAPRGSPTRAGAGAVFYYVRKAGGLWVAGRAPFAPAAGGQPGDAVGAAVAVGKDDVGFAGAPGLAAAGRASQGGAYVFEDVSPPPVDLRVEFPRVTVTAGRSVTIHATACANGPVAGPVELGLTFYDRGRGPPLCKSTLEIAGTTTFTAAGCQSFEVPLGVLPSGRWWTTFWVDPRCKVVEADKYNNGRGNYISVAPRTANVTVRRFTASVSGGKATWSGTICQSGTVDARDFDVALWLHEPSTKYCGARYLRADVEGRLDLAPGGCYSFTLGPAALPRGSYTSRILVDARCDIDETDEGDNQATAVFAVP